MKVLVTGATGSIGRAICKKFIYEGHTVSGVYFQDDSSAGEMNDEYKEKINLFKFDLSDFSSAEKLFSLLDKRHLIPEVVINNAGISIYGLLQDLSQKEWDKIWNTNVTSAISVSRAAIPYMIAKKGGTIVNISSVWGISGASCETAYSATKGAINSFTKALAKELAPSGITVNALACGMINSKMNSRFSNEEIADITESIPEGRLGLPEDVSDAVYALSMSGNYLTGQIIALDGGWI